MEISTREAIKIAEKSPILTPKEREKILAISLFFFMEEEIRTGNDPSSGGPRLVKLEMLWKFSQYISQYPIPDLNIMRVIDMRKNPKKYVDYK